jgi:hypothetical protein
VRLMSRLIKLETAHRRRDGVFVVSGDSDDEYQRQIDELIECGKATPDSLFVCLRTPLRNRSDRKPDGR